MLKFSSKMNFLCRIACDPHIKNAYVCSKITHRCMAGHAKWQNIKHVKAEKDRQKNVTCNKFSFLISLAVREGGKDPKLNNKLGLLMEQAKKSNVPLSTIENAIKKDPKKTKFGSMEVLGPGGCIIIIEYESDNISHIRHEVKSLCKRNGASVMSGEGRWRAAYEQKGIIKAVSLKGGLPFNAEKALDDAILAGAEEVVTKEEDEGKPYLEFLCAPDDLNMVKKAIETSYDVEEGYVGYLPIVNTELNKEDMASLDKLLDDLGNLSEVVRIYENVQ